jgi:RNA polymerase primary sigma factor
MKQLRINHNLTDRTFVIDKLFSDIAKYNPLTADEEAELAYRIREGDEAAKEKLIKHNLKFVVSCAKQYHNKNLQLSDLIQAGSIGIIEAAKRFDETKGFKFISYAVWWIRQSINNEIYNSHTIRLPMNQVARVNKQLNAVEKSRQQLNIGLSNYVEYCDILPHVTRSTDDTIGNSPDSDTFGDMLSSTDCTDSHTIAEFESNNIRSRINKLLDNRSLTIIVKRYGLNGKEEETLDQIAEQMKLSRERVRQLELLALKKLKRNKHLFAECFN